MNNKSGGSYDGGAMDRITVRMPETLVDNVDDAVDVGHAPNRSELIRRAVDEFVSDLDIHPVRCDGGQTAGGGVKGTRIISCGRCEQITLHEIVYSEHYDQEAFRCRQCKTTKVSEQATLQEAADS